MRVEFKVGKSIQKLNKIRSNLQPQSFGMMVDIAESYEQNLKGEAPRWSGYLQDRIKVSVDSDKVVSVRMPYYGIDLNNGHILSYPSDDTTKLKRWVSDGGSQRTPARSKAWYYNKFVSRPESGRVNSSYQTTPNRFIERAWQFTKDEIPELIQKRLDRMMK